MSVLVTGAAGFLGSAVLDRLLARGEKNVRCLVRATSDLSKIRAVRERYPEARIEVATADLASRANLRDAVQGAETIFHVAAGLRGSPADLFLNTVVASRNLLEAAETAKRVVLVSSFSVYGAAELRKGTTIDETTPLETHPEKRDAYSYAKLRQELLVREYQKRRGFELVVLRPGVVYGPGGSPFSMRVGLQFPGVFLHCGRGNPLPLTYVDNCAEAVVTAGGMRQPGEVEVYNVLDDGIPSCRAYLRAYRRQVSRLRVVTVPYSGLMILARLCQWYHSYSRGQLPAVLTPYKAASAWKRMRFDNARLKALGWRQLVSTEEGLSRTFDYFRRVAAQRGA